MCGEAGRKAFFESRNLNFHAGFTGLLTGIPAGGNTAKQLGWLRYFKPGNNSEQGAWFKYFTRTIMSLTNGKALADKLNVLTEDVRSMCEELATQESCNSAGDWRVFEPFENLYELIYKLSFRMLGPNEISEDRNSLKWAMSIHRRLEEGNSMARIIFPWLITPNFLKRIYLAARLYLSYMRIIKKRETGQRQDDSTQYLLDRGDAADKIIKAQIGAIWAAGLTTSATASWGTVLLATNPEWKDKCRDEVDAVVHKYRTSAAQSPMDVLGALTLQQWETEFPLIELCIRETIRVSIPGTVFRKNLSGASIPIGKTGEVIPDGSFVAFLTDSVHMNPRFYPEPQRFNPGRYLDHSRSEETEAHTYIGWGCGRNPCLGMRMAKLDVTLTLAHLLATFDFEMSDRNGDLSHAVPPMPDRNEHKAQGSKTPIHLRARLRTSGTLCSTAG